MAIHIPERKKSGLGRTCRLLAEVLMLCVHIYSGWHGKAALAWLSV
jgi:hypothetical protein